MSNRKPLFKPARTNALFRAAPSEPSAAARVEGTIRPTVRPPLDGGLHAQLAATQAAAARQMRGRTLRVAIGFAAFGIAAALWAGPNVERTVYGLVLATWGSPADDLTTASVGPLSRTGSRPVSRATQPWPAAASNARTSSTPRRYVVRRSVMQAPGEVCIVNGEGPAACRRP